MRKYTIKISATNPRAEASLQWRACPLENGPRIEMLPAAGSMSVQHLEDAGSGATDSNLS